MQAIVLIPTRTVFTVGACFKLWIILCFFVIFIENNVIASLVGLHCALTTIFLRRFNLKARS